MDRVNPVYIPRNHQVEEALAAATDGDLEPFRRLLDVLAQPFDERPGLEPYAAPAPPGFGAVPHVLRHLKLPLLAFHDVPSNPAMTRFGSRCSRNPRRMRTPRPGSAAG